MNWLLISGGTAFFWGCSSILAKIGTVRLQPHRMLIYFGVTIIIFYWFIWKFFGTPFPYGNYLFPLFSEGCASFGFIFYYKALKEAPVSLVAPVSSSGIIISVLIGIFVFKNPINGIQIASILSITSGIILMTIKTFDKEVSLYGSKWIVFALGSMISWGIWGGFSEISTEIVRPVNINLFSMGLALTIWTPYYIFESVRIKRRKINGIKLPARKDLLFASGSAILSGTGSLLFYIAVDLSFVSLVIPVTNLHPIVPIVYDILNRNYPKIHQWIGIILIMIGLFFINGG